MFLSKFSFDLTYEILSPSSHLRDNNFRSRLPCDKRELIDTIHKLKDLKLNDMNIY